MAMRSLLMIAICVAIVAMAFFTNWATMQDLPPFFFSLDFKQPIDLLNGLVVLGPVIIILLNLTNFKFRPALIFLAALTTLSPFAWYIGNLAYSSLTSEFVLGGDRLWLLRLVSIAYWVQLTLVILLLILAGLGLMDSEVSDEEGSPEIQSV